MMTPELRTALPHRAPMIWIDDVVSSTATGGVCSVDLSPSGVYFAAPGRLLAFAPIEWMAQAYGYARAHAALAEGVREPRLQRAYLVGITDYEEIAPLPMQGKLLIEVHTFREMPPLSLVQGTVSDDAGKALARARLKLYFES